MEAVCEVARPTWYRNTTGPEGSPERAVWVYVWPCVCVCYSEYGLFLGPAWMSEFVGSACMDSPAPPQPPLQSTPPLTTPPSLFLSLPFPPSIRLSPNGQYGCLSGNCAVGGRNAPGCIGLWVSGHVATESVYMSLGVCLPPWRCFILRPTSQWFWEKISVGLFPGTLLLPHQLCVCV